MGRSTSYLEVKTIPKAKQHSKWRHAHPRYKTGDLCYLLNRGEQLTVFRLRKGYNRLSYHLYSKLRIGQQSSALAVPAVRQQNICCSPATLYEPLRKGIRPVHIPLDSELYGSVEDLRRTATFIEETGVSLKQTKRKKKTHLNKPNTKRG